MMANEVGESKPCNSLCFAWRHCLRPAASVAIGGGLLQPPSNHRADADRHVVLVGHRSQGYVLIQRRAMAGLQAPYGHIMCCLRWSCRNAVHMALR